MPWLIFKRRLDFCKDVSLGSFGFVDTQNHHFKKHECHQWLWQIHCNINEKGKMLQRFQPWSVRPQKLQSTRQQSHRWKRGESLLPLLCKIGWFFAKPWASVRQSQIRKNPLLHSHWQHYAWDTVDGQIIQTLDNFIPRAPQISKLFSSSKGWDGWTKQIKPRSMT